MTKKLALIVTMIQVSVAGWAGYMPPPDDPWWCYEACIDSYGSNHIECIKKCYSDARKRNDSFEEVCNRNFSMVRERKSETFVNKTDTPE